MVMLPFSEFKKINFSGRLHFISNLSKRHPFHFFIGTISTIASLSRIGHPQNENSVQKVLKFIRIQKLGRQKMRNDLPTKIFRSRIILRQDKSF